MQFEPDHYTPNKSTDIVESYNGLDELVEKDLQSIALNLNGELDSANNNTNNQNGESLYKTLSVLSNDYGLNPFHTETDPRLNPLSENFDSRLWVKNMRKLMDMDPSHYKPSSLSVSFKDLSVRGVSSGDELQPTVSTLPVDFITGTLRKCMTIKGSSSGVEILKPMSALLKSGSLTLVLGKPGAGCTTLLRTISANTAGLKVDKNSSITYEGFSVQDIQKYFRGEVIYSSETDNHFPHLTVGETLTFAASLRTPQNRTPGITREQYIKHMTEVS